ncbi:site-specific DNA-methyltransferase [Mesorhizobium sp. BR1-1-12]|uniref:site-specific DNA-methyltransferase n=1 Tax=unclassified Mesorhizobium TaxID=325217 RepID=UPI001CCAE01A|nr:MULTISPECIES: site-specific DNA-methyltransferase [unclassified Mesorhizobium]MBZ9917107.1 site-specific DNA-methyltransferase [Mesorhizobium sp. BR1-1-7]MBZ9968271.1 site-specific DNA-methyltransferase [Mesorhizobium sp. BR1-1-12]
MNSEKQTFATAVAASEVSLPERLEAGSADVASKNSDILRNFLAQSFPECLSEGRIDFDNLKRALGTWVETSSERFGLVWPGKAECMKIIQQPSFATLKPAREESMDFDVTGNVFIEGDNLEVLKLLQKSYFGKVKMIYIDPPYNTGQEFIYPDKYAETLETYLSYTGQVDAKGRRFSTNTDTIGRYHSNWLNMMYPRLYLARNLLRDDGAIFISIDDHEATRLRELCDQIFGEENFKADIAWQKRYTRSNNTTDFTTVVEHVLVYAKSEAFEVNLLPRTEEADARYSNPDNDPRGVWKGASFLNPASPQERPNLCYPLQNPITGGIVYPTTNAWRRSKDAFEELSAENRLYWGPDGKQSVPSIKMFLSDARGLTPTNFWAHDYAGHTDEGTRDLEILIPGKVFNNPKPVQLIRRAIEHACNGPNDIILDFFAGSGATAQAVVELNREDGGSRRFIIVQLPEHVDPTSNAAKAGFATIAEIGKERIRRLLAKIRAESEGRLDLDGRNQADLGFKVFKLDRSNFKVWTGAEVSDNVEALAQQLELHVDHRLKGSTREDVVYEILLKAGFSLATKIVEIDLAGSKVFSVADGALLICLDDNITSTVIDALAEANPLQVICLDEGFRGNDQLKANAVQTFKARAQAEESEIVFKTV